MNKLIRCLLILVPVLLQSGRAATQEQGATPRAFTTITGAIENLDRDGSIIVIKERAIEYDDKLIVRDRAGKVLANGLAILRAGLKVRCVESQRERRPFTSEVWIQDVLDQPMEGTRQ
jgi:hypothetical protein